MKINIIAAKCINNGIGFQNKIYNFVPKLAHVRVSVWFNCLSSRPSPDVEVLLFKEVPSLPGDKWKRVINIQTERTVEERQKYQSKRNKRKEQRNKRPTRRKE